MAKTGRPPIEIDKKSFENLCSLQCTQSEICDLFEITDKTLNSWCKRTYSRSFSEVFAIKRGRGKISLRRSQFRLAKTNAAMAIFLGKQYLGQRDVTEVENKVSGELTVASDPYAGLTTEELREYIQYARSNGG